MPLAISYCSQYTAVRLSYRSDFDQSFGCLEVGDSDLIEFVWATVEILEIEFDSHQSNSAVRNSIIVIHNYYSCPEDFHEWQNSLDLFDRRVKIATELRKDRYSSSYATLKSHVADSYAVRFAA